MIVSPPSLRTNRQARAASGSGTAGGRGWAEITGLPEFEGKYTLTEIVRHPVMTLPNGTESAGWNVPRMVKVVDGRAVLCGGHFQEPT